MPGRAVRTRSKPRIFLGIYLHPALALAPNSGRGTGGCPQPLRTLAPDLSAWESSSKPAGLREDFTPRVCFWGFPYRMHRFTLEKTIFVVARGVALGSVSRKDSFGF